MGLEGLIFIKRRKASSSFSPPASGFSPTQTEREILPQCFSFTPEMLPRSRENSRVFQDINTSLVNKSLAKLKIYISSWLSPIQSFFVGSSKLFYQPFCAYFRVNVDCGFPSFSAAAAAVWHGKQMGGGGGGGRDANPLLTILLKSADGRVSPSLDGRRRLLAGFFAS